jgi:hypothetical protein
VQTDMVDGNKIIIIFYFIYCVCANYKCYIMPSSGPDLENKVSCILYSGIFSNPWSDFTKRPFPRVAIVGNQMGYAIIYSSPSPFIRWSCIFSRSFTKHIQVEVRIYKADMGRYKCIWLNRFRLLKGYQVFFVFWQKN